MPYIHDIHSHWSALYEQSATYSKVFEMKGERLAKVIEDNKMEHE